MANNTVRLRALDLVLNDGDAVGTWANPGTAGTSWTQATAGFKPTFKAGVMNGHPAARFDGTDDRMTNGTNIGNFVANNQFMGILVFRCNAAIGANNEGLAVDVTN